GWTVKLAKGEFNGRSALARFREAGPDRVLVGIRCAERTIPRHGARLRLAGEESGEVTSGTHSFFLGAGIGMASVTAGRAPVGTQLEIEARGALGSAEVVKLPFYRGSVRTPVAGTVVEVNERLAANPELVNNDPLGEGWLIKVQAEGGLPENLLDEAAYQKLAESGGH